MALYDEHFYTNIYHGIPLESEKTIKGNIAMLQKGSELMGGVGDILSFGSIFAGPMGKVGSFLTDKLFDDLGEIGDERLNKKVKIIAQQEESVELIKTLFETEHGQTPHVIMLSELVKRHQDEITELSKKYDKTTIKSIFNDSTSHHDTKYNEIIDGISELKTFIHKSNEEKYVGSKKQLYYNTFNFLSQVGIASDCDDLTKTAQLAISGLMINDSINTLLSVLGSGGSFTSMINPITSILSVGIGLVGMFKKKKSNNMVHIQMILQQLNMIRQQLQTIHSEMRESFRSVFEHLENITEKLQIQYTVSINIYEKIVKIEKSIENLNIICEYYGKQILVQDLYRTIHKIIRGTPEYFMELGQSGFNELFMENHSFDHGLNGYVYSATTGGIIGNLNSSVHNRIGYLASLLGFPQAHNTVNPIIFNICADAMVILIHKALPHYGSIPLSFDAVVHIINKANLTEQFIDWSRQPEVLQIQLTQYNQLVDELRANLLQWIDNTRYKIGYNIHNMTLDEMVSATPISTGVRYAVDINKHFTNLPIELASQSISILQLYKMCEVAIKLGLGNYDFRFGLSHGYIFGWRQLPVDINIHMDFILNGTRYNINCEQWHAPNLIVGSNGILSGDCLLRWWQHDYKSQRWTLKDWTQTNTYFESILRQACETKLNSIRQEMSSLSYSIGTQVNTLCDKLQEKYTVISKLFELNDSTLEHLNSGVWIKTKLIQLINHENTCGYNIVSFCDFVKEKATQVMSLHYNHSFIKESVRSSIDKLDKLSRDIPSYLEDYKSIKEYDRLAKIEYEKQIQQEQALIQTAKEHQRQQQIATEIKATYERETLNISKIGMQIGRSITLNTIIKQLKQLGKMAEAEIIKSRFESELQYDKIEVIDETSQTVVMFNSSFCNGSSMALLEISFSLRDYPHTICDIQLMGHKVLEKILTSSTKSIGYTVSQFLIDK